MTVETMAITATIVAISIIVVISALWSRGKAKAQLQQAEANLTAHQQQLQQLNQEIRQWQNDYTRVREDNARLLAEKQNAEKNLQQQESKLQQDMENMKNVFTTISQEITSKNTEQASNNIKNILEPLKEKIDNFNNTMRQEFTSQTEQRTVLKTQIENIISTSKTLKDQTDNLSNALKADIRVQGRWGEVMLERIVQAAGLREGQEYITQGRDMDIKYEHGGTMKPDLVIRLPDNRNIIIDAKVSLKSYQQYVNAETEEQQQQELENFTTSMRNHIVGLAQREYHGAEGINSPDFTLLFTPIEGAFSLMMQTDSSIQEQAWHNHIAVVSPTTLWPILMTVQSLWRIENQNRNAMKIAEEGGKIYDKIVNFTEDMNKLGNQIETVTRTYDAAMTKLSDGRGNILSKTEKLKSMGATTSKQLPRQYSEEEQD